MRDVAIITTSQSVMEIDTNKTSVEVMVPVIDAVVTASGLDRRDIGFWCHGSCDYMVGQPFSFVSAVDAIGAFPPIVESHVEMDGAWALYEAWIKIQLGDCDSAVVFANGKSSSGDINRIMSLQLDPYVVGPLWPDERSIAAMQARVLLERGIITETEMAHIAARSRRDGTNNPNALVTGHYTVAELLAMPRISDPLRAHDCPPVADNAVAVVLAAGDLARSLCERPAWIRGIEHRIDMQNVGARDLTGAPSARLAAQAAGAHNDKLDVAELHAPFTHQELILHREMSIDSSATRVNPSGGPLCGNPMMAAGLLRIVEATNRIADGSADRVLGHASSGPLLQQNLVCVMEGD